MLDSTPENPVATIVPNTLLPKANCHSDTLGDYVCDFSQSTSPKSGNRP
jgi:hypothetical protein